VLNFLLSSLMSFTDPYEITPDWSAIRVQEARETESEEAGLFSA
jgi:hypothetical protein